MIADAVVRLELEVSDADAVFADDDGVLFVPLERATEILEVAAVIHATERRQAAEAH